VQLLARVMLSYFQKRMTKVITSAPGTAKTTICEALAQRLGYDFVCIGTMAFLADGLSNVAAPMRYVFSRLMALKNAVVLFDEIEGNVMSLSLRAILLIAVLNI
jgi:broad-specificity NMP kinase